MIANDIKKILKIFYKMLRIIFIKERQVYYNNKSHLFSLVCIYCSFFYSLYIPSFSFSGLLEVRPVSIFT